jgi:L-alanine-DL-glutamate epimerase-like enolase superfamily enzyme
MNQYEGHRRTLEEQVITEIEYFFPRAIYPRLHGKNAIRGYHGYGGIVEVVKISTNQGSTGWASLCREYVEAKKEEKNLLGKKLLDVFDPETGILDDALVAFDIALHDLAGKILGIPVSHLINPNAVQYVRVYDGAIYMNDIISEDKYSGIEQILEDCRHDYVLGYRDMKVKIGRGHQWMEHDAGMRRDIEVVRAIHGALPDVRLMVDANDGYTLEDCFTFLKGIEGIPVYWFEEPFREKISDNKRLREFMKIHSPITLLADGESMTDIPLLFDLAENHLLDIWMPDVCEYGFTAWRKLLKELKEHGYLASPHAWGQMLKTHYCSHLAAAYPENIPIIEGVLGITEGVRCDGYKFDKGIMKIPLEPGFGMELYWAPTIEGGR